MIVRQPYPSPVLRPVIVYGNAAGNSTSVTIRHHDRPRTRPTFTRVWLAVLNPVEMFNVTGQTTAFTTTKISELTLSPNQMIAIGNIATDGSGFSIEVVNSTASSTKLLTRARTVKAKARATPIRRLIPSSFKVVHVAPASAPLDHPRQSALKTSPGGGKINGLTSDIWT